MVRDGRNITGGTQAHRGGLWERVWNGMSRQERRDVATGARPMNRDGSSASKEQVQQRRWARGK